MIGLVPVLYSFWVLLLNPRLNECSQHFLLLHVFSNLCLFLVLWFWLKGYVARFLFHGDKTGRHPRLQLLQFVPRRFSELICNLQCAGHLRLQIRFTTRVVGGMSAFFFLNGLFFKQYLQSGVLEVSGVYGNVQKVSKNRISITVYLYIYILYYYQDTTLLLHMCISIWKYMSRITLELSQVRINEAAFTSCFSYVFNPRCRALSLVFGLEQ